MKPLLIYLLLINAAGFLLMLIDKQKAKENLWRIPEATLLGVAFVGGSFGVLLGMQVARHKTKHWRFSLGVPAIFAVHCVLAMILYLK